MSEAGPFIRERLKITGCAPGLVMYMAHPGSGLSRLGGDPPYWAYLWPGGAALIRHIAAVPGLVAGRRILDLGAGSGLVGIAAAKAGAAVSCADPSAMARAAIALNAEANGVDVTITDAPEDPPHADLILAGDCFYDPVVAAGMAGFLDRCADAGIPALVGDIGRPDLPRDRLAEVAAYPVREVGVPADRPMATGRVFQWVHGGQS